jgi:hypothetical protein
MVLSPGQRIQIVGLPPGVTLLRQPGEAMLPPGSLVQVLEQPDLGAFPIQGPARVEVLPPAAPQLAQPVAPPPDVAGVQAPSPIAGEVAGIQAEAPGPLQIITRLPITGEPPFSPVLLMAMGLGAGAALWRRLRR